MNKGPAAPVGRVVVGETLMIPPELGPLPTLIALIAGGSLFLRIVAKEKHRREKWLQFRLETKIKELKDKQQQAKDDEDRVITVH